MKKLSFLLTVRAAPVLLIVTSARSQAANFQVIAWNEFGIDTIDSNYSVSFPLAAWQQHPRTGDLLPSPQTPVAMTSVSVSDRAARETISCSLSLSSAGKQCN